MITTDFKIKDLHIKNRVVMAPMCMYSAKEDGMANAFHVIHYATRAYGGVGLIIEEATAVVPEGRITLNDLGIWSDNHMPELKRIVDAVHKAGAKMGIQLAHAGRKAKVPQAYAPSSIAFEGYDVPTAMTIDDIKYVVHQFKEAAKRAYDIGYDMIEIHAAHGYLINEFLSPLTNHRTDRYQDGVLFLEEIILSVREVWPAEKPLCIRVTAEEYVENGLHPIDLVHIINRVKHLGIDLVDVSSGGNIKTDINVYPGYQLPFAEIIRRETRLPVIGGGLIEELAFGNQAIIDQKCDMIYLGRLLLREPYAVMNQLEVPYLQAYSRGQKKK